MFTAIVVYSILSFIAAFVVIAIAVALSPREDNSAVAVAARKMQALQYQSRLDQLNPLDR